MTAWAGQHSHHNKPTPCRVLLAGRAEVLVCCCDGASLLHTGRMRCCTVLARVMRRSCARGSVMVEARYKHAWCVAAQQQQQCPCARRLLNIASAAVAVAYDGCHKPASPVHLTTLAACRQCLSCCLHASALAVQQVAQGHSRQGGGTDLLSCVGGVLPCHCRRSSRQSCRRAVRRSCSGRRPKTLETSACWCSCSGPACLTRSASVLTCRPARRAPVSAWRSTGSRFQSRAGALEQLVSWCSPEHTTKRGWCCKETA